MLTLVLTTVISVVTPFVLGDNILEISNASEFIEFSEVVNSGTTYLGTTVFLDNDINFTNELSQWFNPINNFRGTFDGQGHIISNLKINSTLQIVGLFGYSSGSTIKNVVMDKSSSFVNELFSENYQSFTGGIIGYCNANEGDCNIENSVNMASVLFSGNTSRMSFIGGIVGTLDLRGNQGFIKNCANYGSVSSAGISSTGAYIGGIAGFSQGSSKINIVYVQNCLNYGTVDFSGKPTGIYIGGIAGFSSYSIVDNCVSSGTVTSSTINNVYIGSIVGYSYYSTISHCYWNTDIGYKECGGGSVELYGNYHFDSTSFELDGTVSIGNYKGSSLIDALNAAADYYVLREYSHWALNKNRENVSFTIIKREGSPLTLNSEILLLPSLASEGALPFDGWYKDDSCAVPLDNFNITIGGEGRMVLYGVWGEDTNNYTISFDTRGGTNVSSITASFGKTVDLPDNSTKEHCKLLRWENEYGDSVPFEITVPSHNITLYAVFVCTHITNARELITFSDVVNSGKTYSGTTVLLGNDIAFTDELSQRFSPIGVNSINYFMGTFDGQGHIIRNLNIDSTSQIVGLFGYSSGSTIKNVVMDKSCSFVNELFSENYQSFTGGIIGYCNANEGDCNIENSVNMASVLFSGSTSEESFIGGIVGMLNLSYYQGFIKNCANYGNVSSAGTSSAYAFIGGIVGFSQGNSSEKNALVQNCLNYGPVNFSGEPTGINIGGIAGYSEYTRVDNCVSSGVITSSSSSKLIGSIVGQAESSSVSSCFWTMDVGRNSISGNTISSVTKSYRIEQLDERTQWVLNMNMGYGPSKWFVLYLNGGNINGIRQSMLVVNQGSFPDPVKVGNNFSYWCMDLECNKRYEQNYLNGEDLYAVWENVSVSFDYGNGTTITKTLTYGSEYSELPEDPGKKEGHTFNGWFTGKNGKGRRITNDTNIVISSDHTLYAHWTINNYTVTFNYGNGTTISKTLTYGSEYGELPEDPERKEGHTFNGWFTGKNEGVKRVTENDNVTISSDHTLYAQWTINYYIVTFNYGNGMTTNMTFKYNETITYPNPTREGCTLTGWDRNDERMTARNITITAQWTINYYTVKFDYGNGTTTNESLKYNETITYPNPTREGCTLTGWDNSAPTVPARNITITARWECTQAPTTSGDKSGGNTGAIVGGVVGAVAALAIAVLVVLFILFFIRPRWKNDDDDDDIAMAKKNPRIVEKTLDTSGSSEGDGHKASEAAHQAIGGILAQAYPDGYKAPSIPEALCAAGLDSERADFVADACTLVWNRVARRKNVKDAMNGISKEDAMAIALYTFDFGSEDYESNPYRIINKALVSGDSGELQRASGLLYLVVSALRRLPRRKGVTLYRGIREGVDMNLYREGRYVVWRGLSSTSPDMGATKAFLANSPSTDQTKGTLFVIENGWGYDLQPYSMFPAEEEILLEPLRCFRVRGVIDSVPVVINLEMLDTPLLLSQVLGDGSV